jgi:hypothetical protein
LIPKQGQTTGANAVSCIQEYPTSTRYSQFGSGLENPGFQKLDESAWNATTRNVPLVPSALLSLKVRLPWHRTFDSASLLRIVERLEF